LTDIQALNEKLTAKGTSTLTLDELISVALHIQPEIVQHILHTNGGLGGLMRLTEMQLRQIANMDDAEKNRLIGLIDLLRRVNTDSPSQRSVIRTPAEAAALVRDMGELLQEQVRVILLDTQSRVMDIVTVYVGTLNMSALRGAEIYREAILRGSASIILVHNHPSGAPQPSPEDVQATRGLAAAGNLLAIPLRDHLIIGREGWVSLRDLNLM